LVTKKIRKKNNVARRDSQEAKGHFSLPPQMIDYGTHLGGGVLQPVMLKKGGTKQKHLEKPVFNTVAECLLKRTRAPLSIIFVPPPLLLAADGKSMEEAAEAKGRIK